MPDTPHQPDGGPALGSEVFTENGRRAVYAGEIDGQKFVRILLGRDDDEYGYEEWPSDKLTPVSRVLLTEPFEVHGEKVAEALARIQKLREEESGIRTSVLDLQKQERELKAAATKFPQIATALDFLEGRITHVVIDDYSGIRVMRLEDALTSYEDSWGQKTADGLKLLCLFGHKKGQPPRWAINSYHDGSGSYTTVDPFCSEEDARAEVQRRADEAFAAWRANPEKARELDRFEKAGVAPQDWLDHVEAVRADNRRKQIEKHRAEIAKLEAEGGVS